MKLAHILQLIILATHSFRLTCTENILFLSLPFYGHLNPMANVAGEMTNLGHTSYITIPEKFLAMMPPKNGVSYTIVEEYEEFKIFNDLLEKLLSFQPGVTWRQTLQALHKVCDRYLFDKELFFRLKSFNASIIVIDGNFVSNCLAIFAYKLKKPFILLGLHNQYNLHRTPWIVSLYNHMHHIELKTFPQRLANSLSTLKEYMQPLLGSPGRNVNEYVPERPDICFERLLRQAELLIIDSDTFLDPARPALPNVKYVGGMATRPAKPLKGNLLKFINASKNGVIVVSPGTFVNWSNGAHLKKMGEAFRKIKYDVVWKHTNSSYSLSNVLLTKWLPQNDILAHPNIKLFITHCGNSGRYESLYHAVPMIGFPVVADQPLNSHWMQAKGFGIAMDIYKYAVDELVRNIEEVIENPKYKKNIAKTSNIFRSQKERPSEKAARLINEMVLFGGDHLRSEFQDIPLYQFLMLDIWAVLFSAALLSLYLTAFLLRKCFMLFVRNKIKKE